MFQSSHPVLVKVRNHFDTEQSSSAERPTNEIEIMCVYGLKRP